jgi:hypothetical protein
MIWDEWGGGRRRVDINYKVIFGIARIAGDCQKMAIEIRPQMSAR